MKNVIFIFFMFFSTLLGASEMLPSFNPSDSYDSKVDSKKKNYSELINFLQTSNNGEYLFYLAIIYANGINTPDDSGKKVKRDVEQSILYFNKAVEAGNYNAGAVLGAFYLYHEAFIVVPDNINKAKKSLQKALKNGVYESSTFLADIYFNYEKKPEKGMKLLFLASEHNNATAQLMVASMYRFGFVQDSFKIEKNDAMASEYLTMACTNKKKPDKVKDYCSKYAVSNAPLKK